MLLNLLRRLRQEDRGAAMASVMGLVLVGGLLTTLVMSSMVSSLSATSATRAGIQAQAAAEAGLAAAYVGLQKAGDCQAKSGVYTSNVDPKYRATIWFGASMGCPTGGGSVRIISTGWASNPGAAGNTSGDVAYLEASYSIAATNSSGSAVYIYDGGSVNAFTVTVGDPSLTGDIRVPRGNFNCTTNSTINGSVTVASGSVYMSNSCTITGSIRALGSITLDNSVQIGGDVVSTNGAVSLNGSIRVGGNVFSNGNFSLSGQVTGSVEGRADGILNSGSSIGGNLTLGGTLTRLEGLVGGNVQARGNGTLTFVPGVKRVNGFLAIGGVISTWGYAWNVPSSTATDAQKAAYHIKTTNNWVGGAVTYSQVGLTMPAVQAAPTVPAWVDWKYVKADLEAAGFVNEIVLTSSQCQVDVYSGMNPGSPSYAVWQQIFNATTPTIVNAFACTQVNFSSSANLTFTFKTDIAFVGNSFKLEQMQLKSNNSDARKVYFLVQDGAPTTAGAQCTNGAGTIETNSTVVVNSPVSAMFYTPCNIKLSNQTKMRGQLYSGMIEVSSGDGLAFVPIGIPGTNLDGVTGGSSSGALSTLLSLRNRSNNGE